MNKKIFIEGMSCGHCVGRVERALKDVEGVSQVTVDLAGKSATVELSSDVENAKLKEAVEDAGYDVTEIE